MKILVIGDGLLGSEIVRQTNWNYISRKKDGIDFGNLKSYVHLLEHYDTIFNCVAFTDTYSDNRELARQINYVGAADLSDYCSKHSKKLIHISTDFVYSNSVSNAKETDLPLISNNWYTYYKLLADEYIQLRNDNFLICRCSFKENPFPYAKAWVDQVGNFDYVDIISSIIIKLILSRGTGVFNVGTGLKSIYDLAIKTKSDVEPFLRPTYVPSNTTMNLEKLNQYFYE